MAQDTRRGDWRSTLADLREQRPALFWLITLGGALACPLAASPLLSGGPAAMAGRSMSQRFDYALSPLQEAITCPWVAITAAAGGMVVVLLSATASRLPRWGGVRVVLLAWLLLTAGGYAWLAAHSASVQTREDMTHGGTMPGTDLAKDSFESLLVKLEAYVSDRPDLTGLFEADRVAHAYDRLERYLEIPAGLTLDDPLELKLAYRPWRILARLRLSAEDLQRYTRGLIPFSTPAREVVREVLRDGVVTWEREDGMSIVGFSEINEYPFTRLDWWPPPADELAQMVVYMGVVRWQVPEARVGIEYYVLVNERTGLVYLLGH